MPRRLKDMEIDEGSFVDKGANPHARVLLFKRKVEKYGSAPEGTYEDLRERIREAYQRRFGEGSWVEATYPEYAVIEEYMSGIERCWSVPWSRENGEIVLGERTEVKRQTEYIEKKGKTEDGQEFPVSDYAYTPEKDKPSTWKLRLTSTPGGVPDARIVGAAVAALGPGFRGQKVQIPAGDLPKVRARVKAAWKKANPDKSDDDLPDVLKGEGMEKAGATFSAKTKGLMSDLLDKMAAAMGSIKNMMTSAGMVDNEEMKKGGSMPITDEVRKTLPEEVQKHLEEQEKAVAELAKKVDELTKGPEDILKGVSEEVKKRIEDAEKRAQEAEHIAKAEKELRVQKEFSDMARELPHIGGAGEVAKMLRLAYDSSKEEGEELLKTLRAANERIAKSDMLTREFGRGGGAEEGSPLAKLDELAKERAKADGTSHQVAYAKVMKTDEGKKFYSQYREEKERGVS